MSNKEKRSFASSILPDRPPDYVWNATVDSRNTLRDDAYLDLAVEVVEIFDGEFFLTFFIKLQTFFKCFTVTTNRFANLKVIWNEDFPFSSI